MLSNETHNCFKSIIPDVALATKQVITCASSLGGPGRKHGEHNGGNSTFGTIKPHSGSSALGFPSSYNRPKVQDISSYRKRERKENYIKLKPTTKILLTALIPQITVVLPILTVEDPSAVLIEFEFTVTVLVFCGVLPSGLTS